MPTRINPQRKWNWSQLSCYVNLKDIILRVIELQELHHCRKDEPRSINHKDWLDEWLLLLQSITRNVEERVKKKRTPFFYIRIFQFFVRSSHPWHRRQSVSSLVSYIVSLRSLTLIQLNLISKSRTQQNRTQRPNEYNKEPSPCCPSYLPPSSAQTGWLTAKFWNWWVNPYKVQQTLERHLF